MLENIISQLKSEIITKENEFEATKSVLDSQKKELSILNKTLKTLEKTQEKTTEEELME